MKKLIVSFIAFSTFLSTTTLGYATEKKELRNMPELYKYEEIITKVNKELNTKAKIPEDALLRDSELDKNEIYNNIMNQTLEEFERNLRNDLQDIKNNFDENDAYIDLTQDKSDATEEGEKIYSEDKNYDIENLPKTNPTLNIKPMDGLSNERAVREVITQNTTLDYGKVFLHQKYLEELEITIPIAILV